MNTILTIEDDLKIAELIALYCKEEGFRCLHSANGAEGLELAKRAKPDLIVLDIMLPGMNGIEILKNLRQNSDVPVLMLTAKSEEMDKIIGLELGADDYLTKPFSPKELMARIKAILRRGTSQNQPPTLKEADLEVDRQQMSVRQNGTDLHLSAIEFKLLWALMSQAGRVFTREQLMESIYDSQHPVVFDRTIDGHIKKLRKKLGDKPKTPRYIESIFGVGYKFKKS
jgi:DNA-binding response OmpR family regulator